MRGNYILLIAGVLASACRASPPALQVGGVSYSESELLGLTGERRQALADLTGFGAAVSARTLDRLGDPLVQQQLKARSADLLRARRALDSLDIGEAQLEAHYLGNPEFELTVRHLIVLSPRYEADSTRALARTKATRALERIREGEAFPDVAAEVSEEPGAEGRQGLLEPGRRGAWVSEFWDAARALEVGEVSPVVETTYGFHVLRLEGREIVLFEEARNSVMLSVATQLGALPRSGPPAASPGELRIPAEDELARQLLDESVPEHEPVAAWDGGWLTAGELRYHLAALERPEYEALLTGASPNALTGEVETAVRWKISTAEASDLGLAPGVPFEAGLRDAWSETANRWAELLGFQPHMRPEALKEVALAALRTTGQNATLARRELDARAPLMRLAFPARWPDTGQ